MKRSAGKASGKKKRQRRRGDRWTYSYGPKPFVVFAFERPERDNQVFVRWTNLSKPDPRRPGEHKRETQGLGIVVRDPETGRLEERLVRAAELAVRQFQARLITGDLPASPAERALESNTVRSSPETLTLREGFALALDPSRGKYATTDTRHYEQIVSYEERLFGGKPGQKPLINPDLPWVGLQVRDVRGLWRAMADAYLRTEGREFGVRAAEQIIDSIFCVAAWLREEARIPSDAARPPDGWRRRLKDEWAQRTGEQQSRPYRPRHTEEEFRRIFVALNDPRVDPRIRLAIELAAECRTGQVLRCTRRMLTLTDADQSTYDDLPAGALGQVTIPGAGKKHGEVVVLTPEQRRAVDDALKGYLAKYEAAWLARELDDYFLFPGSRMRMLDETGRRWERRVRAGVKALSRDGARQAFRELEAIAKVDHIPGRGWYGLRRQAADMAETATNDDRVKDRLGGWQDSQTRKSIYQDRQTDALRAEAASVRRQLRLGRGLVVRDEHARDRRGDAASAAPNEGPASHDEIEAVWASLTRAERRALLRNVLDKKTSK
jgi:hypothetical protein